jgi:hypothetical protein
MGFFAGQARSIGRFNLESKAGFAPTLHHVARDSRTIINNERGIYAFDDLVVLKTARMPAVLLECGVIVIALKKKSSMARPIANVSSTRLAAPFRIYPRPTSRSAGKAGSTSSIGSNIIPDECVGGGESNRQEDEAIAGI